MDQQSAASDVIQSHTSNSSSLSTYRVVDNDYQVSLTGLLVPGKYILHVEERFRYADASRTVAAVAWASPHLPRPMKVTFPGTIRSLAGWRRALWLAELPRNCSHRSASG